MHRTTLATLLGLTLLAGCADIPFEQTAPAPPPVVIAASTDSLRIDPQPETPVTERSRQSQALMSHYRRFQDDRIVRGMLRTDGGGPDALFTDTMLVRNFERIALREEYTRGQGFSPAVGGESAIKKWLDPVRVTAEFGPSVPGAQATADRNALGAYVRRLNGITAHPISMVDENPNFHVLFLGTDDIDLVAPRVRELMPDVSDRALAIFNRLPRNVHCLVMAFSKEPGGYEYGRAIAVIRAEHPDLMRLSCIHEEVAQGLGLTNDHPRARPSIFNDDEEFALLTTHDALLLELLYDPALTPGMTSEDALPIVRRRAETLMGGAG